MMIRRIVGSAFALAALVAGAAGSEPAPPFTEPFAGTALDRAWAVRQQNGSVTIAHDSSADAGVLVLRSVPGGQREIDVRRDAGGVIRGTVRAWFFDDRPGEETLYAGLQLLEAAHPERATTLGVQDFDAFFYLASIDGEGPASGCGRYPAKTTTAVGRSRGWHEFAIASTDAGVSLAIDGRAVFARGTAAAYDQVRIYLSGPHWRPDAVTYWHGLRYDGTAPLDAEPEPPTAIARNAPPSAQTPAASPPAAKAGDVLSAR
jgi:hypothetical protein